MVPDEIRIELIRNAGELINEKLKCRSPINGTTINDYLFSNKKIELVVWNHDFGRIRSRRDAIKNICYRC